MENLNYIKDYQITVDHVIDGLKKLPERSVHSCVTSPPYFFLRDYNSPSQVWGGSETCQHSWETISENKRNGEPKYRPYEICQCGAWKGELGLEPYVDLYIEHMVLVMREVRRVLRDDGTVFLNIGDTANGNAQRQVKFGVDLHSANTLLVPWRLGI